MSEHTQEFIDQDTNTLQFRAVIDFFKNKRDGVFIEMGAADGILGSNTYRLERDFGWDGILIEPIKEYCDQISKYRKASHVFNICIGETEGSVEFTRIEGYSKLLSGISDQYPSEHKDRINREVQSMGQKIHVDMVPCKKLISVLNECSITHVDYLSIDVEGGELSVLKSMCMEENSNIRPTLISVENPYHVDDMEKYLSAFGYHKVGRIASDDFFLHTQ